MNILVDIDHTLSDAAWRDSMIGTVSWDEYHAASKDDNPIPQMIKLINTLHEDGYYLIGLTSRPDKWRALTVSWLLKYGVELDEILMRPNNDYRPAPELKTAQALERFPDLKNEVLFVMDDRQDVVEAFKGLGVIALQVYK